MTKEIEKQIPEKFKRKFDEIEELNISKISQEKINKMKKNLGAIAEDDVKLVSFEFHFLAKNGILVSAGGSSEGFDKEEWEQ
jgi:hypothetical protein